MDLTMLDCMEGSGRGKLHVWTPNDEELAAQGILFFSITEDHPAEDAWDAGTHLDRNALLRLYSALGEHLYPVHTTEAPNRSLIEQLIERAVADQVAAVLPLHLAPMADRWGYVDAGGPMKRGEPYAAPYACAGGWGCDTKGPHARGSLGCGQPLDDPEPHDIGHPEPATCASAGEHRPQDCPEYPQASTAGRWEAELRRDAGRSLALPYCDSCGHSRIRHDSGRCSVRGCLCNWDGKP